MQIVCVEGPPGVGKSTVVRRVLADFADQFPEGIVWIAAGRLDTRDQLEVLLTEVAECLGFGARLPNVLLEQTVDPERLDREPEGTGQLLRLIAGLPLHAHLAASGLQRMRHQTISDYTQRLKQALTAAPGTPVERDPVIRSLLDNLGASLPEGALTAARDLALGDEGMFGLPYALAVINRPEPEVRAILDALLDAYILEPAENPGAIPRMRFEDWAIGASGPARDEALDRVFEAGPAILDRILVDHRADVALSTLTPLMPALRGLLNKACHALAPGTAPARGPDALPPLPVPQSTGLANLPTCLLQMVAVFRLAPPAPGGVWATVAAAVARAAGRREEYASVSWLLAWWWFLRGDDLEAACAWSAEAAAVCEQTGPSDLAVSMLLHTAMISDARQRVLAAAATVDVAVIRSQLGQPADPSLVDDALCLLVTTFGGDGMMSWAARHLVEQLGGSPGFTAPSARGVFLGIERHQAEAAVQHLLEIAGQLGVACAHRPDDTAAHERLGRLSPWVVAGFPLGASPGPVFDLLLPLEPLADLLRGEGNEHALRFVAAVRDEDHAAYRAVRELGSE